MSEIKGDPTDWVEFVLERFIYKGKTGTVHWRTAYSSDGCGALISSRPNTGGYLQAYICGKRVLLHHIVWVLTTGNKPTDGMHIDHIDGDKHNNSNTNLREVDQSTNLHNQKAKGYCWHTKINRWHATIRLNNKQKHLGYFSSEEEARAAYEAAKKQYGLIYR